MSYAEGVKTKAKEIRKAATKYRAKEVDRERRLEHSGDPYQVPQPPGDKENGAPVPPGDGDRMYNGELLPIMEGDEDWKYIYEGYAWIEEVFEPWADIMDPSASVPVVDALAEVAGKDGFGKSKDATVDSVTADSGGALGNSAMDSADETFSLVESSWEGAGADAFMDFIANVVPAQRNQIALGRALRAIAIANHDMLEGIRKTVKDTQKDALAAIEAQGDGGIDWGTVQTLMTIGGVVAAFASGVGALPAVAAIGATRFGQGDDDAGSRRYDGAKAQISIFSAGTLLRAFMPTESETPKLPMGADTVDGVLDNMANALVELYDKKQAAEDKIMAKCDKNLEFIRDYDKNGVPDIDASKPILVAPRPKALVDAPRDRRKDTIRPDGAPVPPSQR